jgi:hypothetical protein
MAEKAAAFVRRWLGDPREGHPVEITVEAPTTDAHIDGVDRALGYVYRRVDSDEPCRSRKGQVDTFRLDGAWNENTGAAVLGGRPTSAERARSLKPSAGRTSARQ